MYLASLFLNGCRMHHIFVSAIFQAGLAQNDFCEANGSWNSWCHHWDLAEEMSGALEDKPERWRATSTFRYDTSTLWEFKWFFLSYVATNMGPISVPYRWLTRLFWEVHGKNGQRCLDVVTHLIYHYYYCNVGRDVGTWLSQLALWRKKHMQHCPSFYLFLPSLSEIGWQKGNSLVQTSCNWPNPTQVQQTNWGHLSQVFLYVAIDTDKVTKTVTVNTKSWPITQKADFQIS